MKRTAARIKKDLLEALEMSMGIVTTACKSANIARRTYYKYYKQDQRFRDAVDEINNVALDFAESKLFTNIKNGKEASIIFYLKTKGRKRGYIEKVEKVDSGNKQIILENGKKINERSK